MHPTMNATPLKRTLSVTGLLLTGASCGVVAIKVVAPQFLSPSAANAITLPHGGEGGSTDSATPRTTVKPRPVAPTQPATRNTTLGSAFALPSPKSRSL